ncbi:MAG: hypothetical protein M9906_09590 [Microthrixaceae bacterium]|nr:hypothetical protein [Microthrixaceae bacterium]
MAGPLVRRATSWAVISWAARESTSRSAAASASIRSKRSSSCDASRDCCARADRSDSTWVRACSASADAASAAVEAAARSCSATTLAAVIVSTTRRRRSATMCSMSVA